MMKVCKWYVAVDDEWHPIGPGQVLEVACPEVPTWVNVWTLEPTDRPISATRPAIVVGTGHDVPVGTEHLGSAVLPDSRLVWHLFGSIHTRTP